MTRSVFSSLVEIVERSEVPFILHEHMPARTVEDALLNLSFDATRIDGGLVLAALRGARKVDYPRLAALVGVKRRDLATLSPEEVRELLRVEPGSVSPLSLLGEATVLVDDDVLTILPTIYCGIGRPDRTLEITSDALVKLATGRIGGFSRQM